MSSPLWMLVASHRHNIITILVLRRYYYVLGKSGIYNCVFTLVWSLEGFQAFKMTTSMLFYFVHRVRLDLTNLYTDFVSLHHFCLFLVVETCLLSLTLFIHPCFKVWLKSSHHGLFVSRAVLCYFICIAVMALFVRWKFWLQ